MDHLEVHGTGRDANEDAEKLATIIAKQPAIIFEQLWWLDKAHNY